MNVKKHYDDHLANFYSWMLGDFNEKKDEFVAFCKQNNIKPTKSKLAIDLGAGSGIQSVALAELGYQVLAIDFNQQLLDELHRNKGELPVEIINKDITEVIDFKNKQAELIVCCGDTISHLAGIEEIEKLITNISGTLTEKGLAVFSFRDYSKPLEDTSRFIPVKNDENRIHTCILEYFEDKVRVTDLLHEKIQNDWQQKVSSYYKVRISTEQITNILTNNGFGILHEEIIRGIVYLVCRK